MRSISYAVAHAVAQRLIVASIVISCLQVDRVRADPPARLAVESILITAAETVEAPARSESEVARAVIEKRADAGLAIEAAARAHDLDFVPLHSERYDLVMMRHDYFEAPVQALLSFARSEAFGARARELGGYEIGELGRVIYNAP